MTDFFSRARAAAGRIRDERSGEAVLWDVYAMLDGTPETLFVPELVHLGWCRGSRAEIDAQLVGKWRHQIIGQRILVSGAERGTVHR